MRSRDVYAAAVKTCGKEHQLIMCMEEMAELTKELSKNIRGSKNTTSISEEMADVEIMMEQLRVIFGNRSEVDTIKAEKLNRLADRLELPTK
jgi:hypothetical protein